MHLALPVKNGCKSIGKTPGPGTYLLPSAFKQDPNKGFQFGIAREAYAKTYIKSSTVAPKDVPGPGTYPLPSSFKNASPEFSLRSRTSYGDFTKNYSNAPGPGHYKSLASISPNGSIFFSKYKNSCAPLFNPPSSARFKQYCILLTAISQQ